MKIVRRKSRSAEVYTSSLNDIMFFLLLFFLIISTMVTPAAIKVMLPKSSTAEKVVTKKNINLSITSDLKYYIDDKEISFDQIESSLAQILSGRPKDEDVSVLLQADKSLNLQDVINVVDIGNKLHVKMVLFTQKD